MFKNNASRSHNIVLKDLGNGEVFIAQFTLDGIYVDIFRIIELSPALKIWLEHEERKFAMSEVEQSVLKNWECGFVDFYATLGTVIEHCESQREAKIQKLLEDIRSRFMDVVGTIYSHNCRWLVRPATHQPGNEYLFVLMGRVMAFDQAMFDTYVKPYLETESMTSAEYLTWYSQLCRVALQRELSAVDYVTFNAHESHEKQLSITDL